MITVAPTPAGDPWYGFLALMVALISTSCTSSDGVMSDKTPVKLRQVFVAPIDQQLETFPSYDFETQYRLYIYGNQKVEPPALYLIRPFAAEGATIVEPLQRRFVMASDEATIRDIVLVFADMKHLGSYDVTGDKALMDMMWQRVGRMKDEFWREFCERELRSLD